MDRAELESLCRAPFALYGLDASWSGARSIASHAFEDDGVPSLVGLGHGVRDDPLCPWIEVTVLGPLHGRQPASAGFPHGASWEINPDPLALFYVAVRAYPILGGEEIPAAEDRLRNRMTPMFLSLNGQPQEFQAVSEGPHWDAIHRTATDHAIVVGASNILPGAVRLVAVSTLDAYSADEHPSS